MHTTKLEKLLDEAIEKLNTCGFEEKAQWLERRKPLLKSKETRKNTLIEMQQIWAGMGSFHDLPWPKELKKWSWEFVDEIYTEMKNEIKKCT